MNHPYADLIGLKVDEQGNGSSRCSLEAKAQLFNPQNALHGGVLYALADTGMGAALYPSLEAGDMCATIEIKINYFKPVTSGLVTCITQTLNKGKKLANLESRIFCNGILVAQANGNFSIFRPSSTEDSFAGGLTSR